MATELFSAVVTAPNLPTHLHNAVVSLSPMDTVVGRFPLQFLYIFPPPPAEHRDYDLRTLKHSLCNTLSDYPLLTGRIRFDPSSRNAASVLCSNAGAVFSAFQSDDAIAEKLQGSSAGGQQQNVLDMNSILVEGLVPDTTEEEQERPLLLVQCTLFLCGSLSIGINSHHSLMDGEASFNFMDAWSRAYRGAPRIEPNHDRHLLFSRGSSPSFPHHEYKIISASTTSESAIPPSAVPTSCKLFHFSASQLALLKAMASAVDGSGPDVPYVTTIDALSGHLTALVTLARGEPYPSEVKVNTGINGRRRLQPPLPPRYVGNAVFNARSSHPVDELLKGANGLSGAARRVRAAVGRMDDEYLRSAVEFVAGQADQRSVFLAVDFVTGSDLLVTSWANMGLRDADFGAGKAIYAGPPLVTANGVVVVLDTCRVGGDGLDTIICLTQDHMVKFQALLNMADLTSGDYRPLFSKVSTLGT